MKNLPMRWQKQLEIFLTESLLDRCYNFFDIDMEWVKVMKKTGKKIWVLNEFLFSVLILVFMYLLNHWVQDFYQTQVLVPMIFVLGVFIISWKTQGYFWGIASSLVSVILVNYAFTYPFYAIDLISPQCVFSACVMLIVSVMTGILTTQLKTQEKIKTETEREHMRANLLRAVSHDLRTPLTSIYGSCSAILENYDSLSKEKQIKLLSEIQEDSQWLIRMVENLLSITRIDSDSNKVKVKKNDTVLEELIDAVIVKFYSRYPEQKVEIELPDEFISIPMDAMLIQQVLMNILENTMHHAKGMTEIDFQVTVEDKDVIFRISDNGCGIPIERMDSLFNGSFHGHQEISDGTRNNMGIGLSVCSAIIKAHDGEIWAENRDDGGASFCFRLKMGAADDE